MILTDAKKSQAQIMIDLENVAGVSVTSLRDGLFSLHLSEVSGVGTLGPGWTGYAGAKLLTMAAPEGAGINLCYFPPVPQASLADSKGDILLVSDHVVELLTKMYQAVQDATHRQLSVTVTEK